MQAPTGCSCDIPTQAANKDPRNVSATEKLFCSQYPTDNRVICIPKNRHFHLMRVTQTEALHYHPAKVLKSSVERT